ncbi:helix-turn-helix transcriptional regulator [Chthonobacter rhizosphaerae]|uniref:helix-turn-helix transcriptional regulator n=1 Tax=Chthonobacter rhizosphaerae TaxID=2735553 RepID=UPI0015EF4CEC|nr:helix-turn-helix transcriptional regulator [Chthonobacter rhizosphaerae]
MSQVQYLTTAEAADYLRLKERKLYELVAEGAIPCTKVTGKWLFPRAALDSWLAAGMLTPPGFTAAVPPPIVGGSHDLLLEWLVRESGCGLALLAEGSARGLERLAAGEVQIAAVHFHDADERVEPNVARVLAESALGDAVVIGFARREQGLVVPPGNPAGIASVPDAVAKGLRFAVRQKGAGAQLLLEALVARGGLDAAQVAIAGAPAPTGSELALAVRTGRADCGVAPRGVADSFGLHFLPLVWERFDLVVRRRTFFEPGAQALFARMRDPSFAARAADLGGYDVAEAGRVLLNR